MLHTLGPAKFDEKFKTIELRRIYLTGIQTKAYWFEAEEPGLLVEAGLREGTGPGPQTEEIGGHQQPVAKPGAKPRPEDDVLNEVPVGSRVTWGTYPTAPGWPVHKDNTVKMSNNLYSAHDVPEGKDDMYSKEKLVEALMEKYPGVPARNVRVVAIEVYDVEKMTATQ